MGPRTVSLGTHVIDLWIFVLLNNEKSKILYARPVPTISEPISVTRTWRVGAIQLEPRVLSLGEPARSLTTRKSFGFVALHASAMVRGLLRTSNLPQLQNLIKRDPVSYKEEFLQQWNHYNSTRQIFQINPAEQASHFRELVTFISQVRIFSCTVCGPNSSV
jgi:hypothetical protein